MTTYSLLQDYSSGLASAIQTIPLDAVEEVAIILEGARQQRSQVFVIGNGGSAATASHMVCDLAKIAIVEGLPRLRVISLTDNMPSVSAWANDTSYEYIFSQQLENLAAAGDVLIAISTSGRSENVLRAAQTAKTMGLTTVGLTGPGGANLRELVDFCITVNADLTGQIEDAHHAIGHMLAHVLSRKTGS